jgi:hypothetical protein
MSYALSWATPFMSKSDFGGGAKREKLIDLRGLCAGDACIAPTWTCKR